MMIPTTTLLPDQKVSTVRWFNYRKGFGLLEPLPETAGNPIRLHHSEIQKADKRIRVRPREGQRVSFVLVKKEKGWTAVRAIVHPLAGGTAS